MLFAMTDKNQRVIAALEVEAAMTEAHAKRLSSVAPNLADPEPQRVMAALAKEETDRTNATREQIRLLRDLV
jgi:rubrerythrin